MVPDIPSYPNAKMVDSQHISLAGGGGGTNVGYASDDSYETVVRYYEQQLGPGDKDSFPGSCRWLFSEVRGGGESKLLLVVESGDADKSPVTRAVEGTSICIGQMYFIRAQG